MTLATVRYQDHVDDITPDQLAGPDGFFDGWPNPPSPDTHLRILAASSHRVVAVDDASGRVVGFVNAVSDGILSAYIPLLEVRPSFKGRGIGTALMTRLLAQLDDFYMVDLLCQDDVVPFYARLGLGLEPAGGMFRRRYDRQRGRPEA